MGNEARGFHFPGHKSASDLERHVARLTKVSEGRSANTTMARAWRYTTDKLGRKSGISGYLPGRVTRQDGTKVLGKIIM
jgi:hypothetical protein